ncbi:MAG: HDOD domain-containing protein [Desulfobacterales bacterium]|nr:HDOD domain-containing protein [Desulfobacterales bacterium]
MDHIPKEHIPAGHLRAAAQSPLVLQAYLGTCLGVALYDAKRKAGGMIHILLPEPPGSTDTDMPEKYASTGIPILIDQLTDLGCAPENLEATIAGGALVGPVSHQDIGLDIGGRTADIAQAFFKEAGIEVIKSETGGFFTCTLELNLDTGETRIKPAWEQQTTPTARFDPPTGEQITQTISTLKPIPQTALKVLRMFNENRHGITDITDELARDQVLSGQTLKLCNSALFSGTIRIDTLKDAVLLLGKDMLVKTVITAAVNTYYDQTGTSGYSLCKGGLFYHAVGVAHAAEHLAEKTGKADAKQAYTAGLLHDIGKVVLDQYIADSAPLLFRNIGENRESFIRSEQKILGITHCRAGSILAESWQFSDALIQVVRHHHNPEAADDWQDLVDIVYLADLLMEKFLTGVDLERMGTRSMAAVLKRLDLDAGDLHDLIDALPLGALTQTEMPTSGGTDGSPNDD